MSAPNNQRAGITVLCLDTAEPTVQHLRHRGYRVETGRLGYLDGTRQLEFPPHEADAIVCDLRVPACYDARHWGAGGNHNFAFTLARYPDQEKVLEAKGSLHHVKELPRYRIVQDSQLSAMYPGSPFGPSDVLRAISDGGVPFLQLLNPEWLHHVVQIGPNLCGLSWEFESTIANRVEVHHSVQVALPEVEATFSFRKPINFKISEGPRTTEARRSTLTATAAVSNAVGDTFGQVLRLGHGTIWLFPQFEDNASFVDYFLGRKEAVRAVPVGRSENQTVALLRSTGKVPPGFPIATPTGTPEVPISPAPRGSGIRDVFISHASEDKNAAARPIASALSGRGFSVWFDEYELVVGDSLLEKIDEGLKNAQFGVVILSPSFFAKRWPKQELAGLFALEGSEGFGRILPVRHSISSEGVLSYSPILADRLGASTSDGIDAVVEALVRAITAWRRRLGLPE